MNPENVNPANFKVEQIIFNNEDFSIAYGVWDSDGNKYVAMRWNGDDEDAGYPKVFGHPMWFLIDRELKLPILQSLIGLENTNKDKLIKVLEENSINYL